MRPDPPEDREVLEESDEPEAPRPGLVGVLTRHRRLLTVVAVIWFGGLMVGGLFLSQLDARLGLNLFGPQVWVAGEPAVVRVALRELRFDRLQPLGAAEAWWVGPAGEVGPIALSERAGDLVQGQVTPPAAGAWTLRVVAVVDGVALQLEAPVVVSAQAPAWVLAPPPKKGPPMRPDRGAVALEIQPTEHVIAANFPGRLTIRAMDAQGAPVAGVPVRLVLREGQTALPLPEQVVTGQHGLVEVPVQVQHPIFWLDAEVPAPEAPASVAPAPVAPATVAPTSMAPEAPAPEAPASVAPASAPAPRGSITRRLKHQPTQFTLVTGTPVAKPGEALAVGLKSLHRTGPVFVDVWQGPRWRGTAVAELANGEARFMLPLPEVGEDPALLWVQAYRSPYLPGTSRGGAYILATKGPAEAAVRHFAGALAAAGHDVAFTRHQATHADGDPVLARYLLSLPPRPEADPPLLTDTSESARQAVASIKGAWQRRFVVGLLISGVLMFAGMLWLLRRNARDVQRRWTEAGGDEQAARGTRVFREGIFLFLILAAFLGALIQLVLVIRW